MPATCSIAGVWDQIRSAPYMSKQQWRAYNLLILCELIGGTPFMGSCTVPGLWNQVRGVGPFLSEQEFMAENINLLCQLLTGLGTGGLGATWTVWEDTGPNPSGPPTNPAIPVTVRFRDGHLPVVWDPDQLKYV